MNKSIINRQMQWAYEALSDVGIANSEGEIEKNFRGQISTFGAAVAMGSLLPAIAFFSEDGGSEVLRSKLMEAVLLVLKKAQLARESYTKLYDFARDMIKEDREAECKEEILNATIAIKLAMNLYRLTTK